MPTRPGQSRALLDELLASQDPVATEAAIARLAIVGRPALRQVQQRLPDVSVDHLPRLLRVLERIGAPESLAAIRPFVASDTPDVAIAAVDALGALLDASDATAASDALDTLTALTLDRSRDEAVRLRAFDVIAEAPVPSTTYESDIVHPLREQLRRDPSDAIRQSIDDTAASSQDGGTTDEPSRPDGAARRPDDAGLSLEAVANGHLPRDAESLRLLLASHGATVPLTVLHRLIERVRAHEAALDDGARHTWRTTRAAAHLALSERGSRLAIYDLRETLEVLGEHTPVGMLSALQQVGDASALEALADAHARSTDTWFRGQLVGIFRAVVEREKLTKRHATIRKIAARLPETLEELWG